jgi:PIN domain nuclease of toxin-antitoxin system
LVAAPGKLSAAAAAAIDREPELGISVFSCWELAMLAVKGRITLDGAVETWIAEAVARDRLHVLPLTPAIAVGAALLGDSFPTDPADRLIYVTARAEGVRLVTRDRAIRDYDSTGTVW